MKRRMFAAMAALVLLSAALLAGVWFLLIHTQLQTQIKEGIQNERVTLIASDGTVIYDNRAAPGSMENHLTRPEVQQALETGTGESIRYSDTMREKTYYFATRDDREDTILRVSLTMDSLYAMAARLLPWIILSIVAVLLLALLLARKMSDRILRPINQIDLDNPDTGNYEELAPLAKRLTEQKREIGAQMAELKARADTIRAVTEHMNEGLLLLSEKGTVLTANPSAEALFDAQQVAGQPLVAVTRDVLLLEKARRCLAGEAGEMEMTRAGRTYGVLLSPVKAGADGYGAVILFLETTARRESERQRREFSANVSHEMKTPLTTILGYAEMLENGMAPKEDGPGFGGLIAAQARRLLAVIEDIIHLSEFDEKAMPRAFAKVDLLDAAQAAVDALQPVAQEKNVALTLEGGGAQVWGDRRIIDEALANVISNAIQYNRPGGIVRVTVAEAPGEPRVTVADTGMGIPKEHLNRVFERFYRVDASRSHRTGGTGLGLSIVKHAMEFHGGRVEMESKLGEGTTVACVFPRR